MLSISNRLSFLRITSQGYVLHFSMTVLFFITMELYYPFHRLQSVYPVWIRIYTET
jgi:hypothetical protein